MNISADVYSFSKTSLSFGWAKAVPADFGNDAACNLDNSLSFNWLVSVIIRMHSLTSEQQVHCETWIISVMFFLG